MSTDTVTVTLTKQADKKYSVKFEEDQPEEGAARTVGTIYIQKWFAKHSDKLKLTIERI
jgi:hypothetical protein